MRILAGGRWTDGHLDWHREPREYRIRVSAMLNLQRIDGLYVVRPRAVRTLLAYLREIGVRDVWRRVRSRTAERRRNEKYLSCGIGRVLEAPLGAECAVGSPVLFIAPSHPPCAERVVLSPALVRRWSGPLPLEERPGAILHFGCPPGDAGDWDSIRGWSPCSGTELPPERCSVWLDAAATALRSVSPARAVLLPVHPSPAKETEPASRQVADPRPAAVLFGYGNYAKVTSLPRIERTLRLTGVHEIDPLQLPARRLAHVAWDTSPHLRPWEAPDAVLVAGYHHTHAGIAAEALRCGAYAVVEKPLCTTRAQLDSLLDAMHLPSRLFACFHKRYLRFNEMAREDLEVGPGEPVDYHCLVYEIPLPRLHWYRWPNSGSRLLSNGCHWIDHFLFLNGFAPPRRWYVDAGSRGSMTATVELENGAYFTMVLTDRGSERTGVQDHVELRAGDRTVRIDNGAEYRAESTARVLRRARAHKLEAYDRMYRTIASAVSAGLPGDSRDSVRVSAGLALDLHEWLTAATGETADRFTPATYPRRWTLPRGAASLPVTAPTPTG